MLSMMGTRRHGHCSNARGNELKLKLEASFSVILNMIFKYCELVEVNQL